MLLMRVVGLSKISHAQHVHTHAHRQRDGRTAAPPKKPSLAEFFLRGKNSGRART
jgi:hypothetical protein